MTPPSAPPAPRGSTTHLASEGYPGQPPTAVITGASSGIGAAAARRLHQLGAHVLPVGRDVERTALITTEVTFSSDGAGAGLDAGPGASEEGAAHEPLTVDFANLAIVRALAQRLLDEHPRIDVLALNAGATVPDRRTTVDGHELTFQANHLGPFLLLQLLAPRLQASGGRVILTSSVGHHIGDLDLDDLDFARRPYWAPRVYGTAKLANLLTACQVSRRLPGVTASAFHPGVVGSGFGSDALGVVGWLYRSSLGRRLTITSAQGAQPLVALATHPAPRELDARYFNRLHPGRTSKAGQDHALGAGLWERSMDLLQEN